MLRQQQGRFLFVILDYRPMFSSNLSSLYLSGRSSTSPILKLLGCQVCTHSAFLGKRETFSDN
jgi:hypothetical protein